VTAANEQRYFETASCEYLAERWHYVKATFDLAVVFGAVRGTLDWVLIRQYRPPMEGWVISPPMGALPRALPQEALRLAKKEAEDETGMEISTIRHYITLARSPGMSTELAHIYLAEYTGVSRPQNLHGSEEIIPLRVQACELETFLRQRQSAGDVIDAAIGLLLGLRPLDTNSALR